MKLRSGFVSNSSSSSFVFSEQTYPTVFDLAIAMLSFRNFGSEKKLIRIIQRSKLNKNTPIAFNTCNYDTFIIKVGEYYAVSTCNNHPFANLAGQVSWKCFPKEIMVALGMDKDDINNIEWMDEVIDRIPYNRTFWWPEYNLFLHKPDSKEMSTEVFFDKKHYCDVHYRPFFKIMKGKKKGTYACPECVRKKKPVKVGLR